jgi:hypothetical protein
MVSRKVIRICVAATLVAVPLACRAETFTALNIDFLGHGGAPQGLAAKAGDVGNVFWNPAGLACSRAATPMAFAGYMDYVAGIRGGAVGYLSAPRPHSGHGFYLTYLASGSMRATDWDDPLGGRGDTFTYSEVVAAAVGGVQVLPAVYAGGALKLGRENLETLGASCLAADLGGTVRFLGGAGAEDAKAYASITARNIKLAVWEIKDTKLPTGAELGLATDFLAGRASAGLSIYAGRLGRREARIGVAGLLTDEFEARLGWRRRIGKASDSEFDLGWRRGLSAGFSVGLGRFYFDYTYEDASPFDGIHRFGLRASLPR